MVARRGDLVKLTYLVGKFSSFLPTEPEDFILVRVVDWKGQLPKSVVARRVFKILPGLSSQKISDHAVDAIGIGLYLKGLL